jgi:ankyrin repeat protein
VQIIDLLLAAGLDVDARTEHETLPWHMAAHKPDETVMAHLIATGIDVNAADARLWSLVHRAAANDKNDKVLATLLAAGANVVVRDANGNTPCHDAVSNPNTAVVALVIPLCDVDAVNNDGVSPCMWAVEDDNSAALALLIGAGANLNAVDNSVSVCARALQRADEKVLELLVNADVDLTTVDLNDGANVLRLAVKWCNHRLVAKLIAAGCDVNATDDKQRTPCHMLANVDRAKAEDAMQSIALLIAAKANVNASDGLGNTPLHYATQVGSLACMSMLQKAGANVRASNDDGETPLHFATDIASAAVLIGAKADIDAVDFNGLSACHHAYNRPRVLSFLIAAGANPHLEGKKGQTALHVAASNEGSIDSMSVLINAKVNVNLGDSAGDCAGHWAARSGRIENLEFLLAHGARINKRNNAGQTMLFAAVEARRDDVVAVLLDAGAATNIRSASSVSPLELSLMHSVEIAARLLRAGVSPHDIGSDGWSTCHFAARSPTHAVQSLRLLIDAGANVHAIDDLGASVGHRAHVSAFRVLQSHGVNLNAVDDYGYAPCHYVRESEALVALFGLGVRMTVKNKADKTPFESAMARNGTDDLMSTFVATGICFSVQTQVARTELAAIVVAGGGLVSGRVDAAALLAEEGAAATRIFERQKRLFRSRALEVCVGLQTMGVSALELCQVLSHMFAPLESVVPFDFALASGCRREARKKMNERERFADAIEINHKSLVNTMLSNREVDANARLRRTRNPPALVFAAAQGRDEIAEMLLNAGARIDDVDNDGQSACHAASDGHHAVMRVLLAHRPNLALRDMRGSTALHLATLTTWRHECALLLILAGASLDGIDRGRLCWLAAHSTFAVQALMDRGVVVRNLHDDSGRTPLHHAVQRHPNDLGLLSMLVDVCGVDFELRSTDNERISCTGIAIYNGHVAALRFFLQAGADASFSDNDPLLHHSIMSTDRQIVCTMLLLAAGADVTARDWTGGTACLLAAQQQQHAPMMKFVHAMVAAGADLDAADENGNTPRLCLAECGQTVDAEQVETARREIAKLRLDFVRHRAMHVCIGLQSLGLDALQLCEILVHACGPLARFIAFHQWWKIATTVKHFQFSH